MEFHVGTDRRHLEIPLAVLPVIIVLVIVGKEPSLGMSGFVSVIVNAEMVLSPVALTTHIHISSATILVTSASFIGAWIVG
jgi:hypothetical protein